MIATETRSQHSKGVTKIGGTVYEKTGYRMDVNLWFRHKNEALFYIDSAGRVHGPMDKNCSTRLGPIQKSGKEISFKKEYSEHLENDQWQKTMEIRNSQPREIRQDIKHFETVLHNASINDISSHRKTHMTLANHYIPNYKNVETTSYSSTITKQNKKPDQGVTVNIIAPKEEVIEKDSSLTRERRLIDELLEARRELNTLRKTKSVMDNSFIGNDSTNFTSEHHVSKVVTDVYPSNHTSEKIKKRHHSTHQENTNKGFTEVTGTKNYQTKQFLDEDFEKIEPTFIDTNFYNEIKNQIDKQQSHGKQIPIKIQTSSRNLNETMNKSLRNVSTSQNVMEMSPVQPVESLNGSLKYTNIDNSTSNNQEQFGEEKTVTIKRKIIKRRKANEPIQTLRDSYIDKINYFPQQIGDSSTDTDTDHENPPSSQSATIPEKCSSRSQQAVPQQEVQEDFIVPQLKDKKQEQMSLNKSENIHHFLNTNESQKTPDWSFRENSLTRRQAPQVQRNDMHESSTYNTYIREKETGPISNYSARKENMKTQQLMDGRCGSMRTLPLDRRMNEMTEEIETITLQPIGKGVQDLAPGFATISRPPSRAATPRAYDVNGGLASQSSYTREEKQTSGYSTMPSMPKFNKYSSARNVNQTSSYDIPDSYRRGASTGRTNQDQVISSTWQKRSESYTSGNRNFQSNLSPLTNHESMMNTKTISSGYEEGRFPLQVILNTEDIWYQPNLSREDVILALRDKEAGSFIIRNSSSFAGAYGLALKVDILPENVVRTNDLQRDLIRHFLIETVDEASGPGVRLKGLTNEPIYPTLAHLVQDHCHNPRALPIKLLIPTFSLNKINHEDSGIVQSQYQYDSYQKQQFGSSKPQLLSNAQRSLSSPGVNFIDMKHPNPLHRHFVTNAVYLGKVDVDRLVGKAAVEHAVTKIMSKKSLKTTTTEIQLDSTNGITLIDKVQALFYTRQFPVQHVISADFDPRSREFTSPVLQNNGINRGRILGIVVRKQKMILRENVVHLFCEIDKSNNLNNIISFINDNYLRRA